MVKASIAALGLFWALAPGAPYLRGEFDDALVVSRSEQIVVGHLEAKSIRYVAYPDSPTESGGGEHVVTLVVSRVLKGDLKEGSVPLSVHYGLTPRVVGPNDRRSAPEGAVEIWDSGNSAASPYPIIEDARKDHVWFLRKLGYPFGDAAGVGRWGVVDPEDMSPLAFEDVYMAFRSENPEERLRALCATNDKIRKRSTRFLDLPDLKALLAEKYEYQRAVGLLLYLIKNRRTLREERQRESVEKASAELVRLFESDPNVHGFRADIIRVWGDLRLEGAVKPLAGLLGKQADYWAGQKLEEGWAETEVPKYLEQKHLAGEARAAVIALGRIGSAAARPELEATRDRWVALGAAGKAMVEVCDAALKALSPK